MLSAEEALKQYYDKMYALELKLKNDLEQTRLRRQGLGVTKVEEDEDDSPVLRTQSSAPTKYMQEGERMLQDMHLMWKDKLKKTLDEDRPANSTVTFDKNFNVKA